MPADPSSPPLPAEIYPTSPSDQISDPPVVVGVPLDGDGGTSVEEGLTVQQENGAGSPAPGSTAAVLSPEAEAAIGEIVEDSTPPVEAPSYPEAVVEALEKGDELPRRAFYMAPGDLFLPNAHRWRAPFEAIKVDRTATMPDGLRGRTPEICRWGFHASPHVLDVLKHRSHGCLTLVDVGAPFSDEEHEDKFAGSFRTTYAILSVEETTTVFRRIGLAIAHLALQIVCYSEGREPPGALLEYVGAYERATQEGRFGLISERDLLEKLHAKAEAVDVTGVIVGRYNGFPRALFHSEWNADSLRRARTSLDDVLGAYDAVNQIADRIATEALLESRYALKRAAAEGRGR